MSKFNIGDKVRYTADSVYGWTGIEGEVISHNPWSDSYTIRVTKTVPDKIDSGNKIGSNPTFYAHKLEKIKPFGFVDIKKGDTIRRTVTHTDGTTITTEGTVVRMDTFSALNATGIAIASWADGSNSKLELVNRPEKPNPSDKVKVGESIVRVTKEDGDTTVFTKLEEDKWVSIYLNNAHPDSNPIGTYHRTNENINVLITSAERAGDKVNYV